MHLRLINQIYLCFLLLRPLLFHIQLKTKNNNWYNMPKSNALFFRQQNRNHFLFLKSRGTGVIRLCGGGGGSPNLKSIFEGALHAWRTLSVTESSQGGLISMSFTGFEPSPQSGQANTLTTTLTERRYRMFYCTSLYFEFRV